MTTRSDVLAALRAAGDDGVSGEALAAGLGVSRAAISKHVKALRDAGYTVGAVPGRGYRLIAVPDMPLPDEVSRLLRSPLWIDLRGGGATRSTNDDACALAARGAPEGTVVLASRQTAGRGRLGRSWESPEGGVYFSVVLRPHVTPAAVAPLALVLALGVAQGLEALGFKPQLKWPNDVLLDGEKVAGILLEMTAETDRVSHVVAGVGLNVRRPQSGAFEGAAYLCDGDATVKASVVAAAVLDGIAEAYDAWRIGGFVAVRDEYQHLSALAGHEVVVHDLQGVVRAQGAAVGVDDDGRLLVDGDAGVTVLSAGEVTLR